MINYIENKEQNHRFGWTIPVKVGSAVIRNKLKRWCREFCREVLGSYTNDNVFYDINVIIKVSRNVEFRKLSREEFRKNMQKAFSQIC